VGDPPPSLLQVPLGIEEHGLAHGTHAGTPASSASFTRGMDCQVEPYSNSLLLDPLGGVPAPSSRTSRAPFDLKCPP